MFTNDHNTLPTAIGDVMVSMFEPWPGQTKEQTGWLGIRIMCPSGETCLSADCCFCEEHYKNPTERVGLVQSGPIHYLIENEQLWSRC